MLHQETVETKTLELLATLQNESLLKPCRLVGGTSLTLQIAHRKSTDLDLFTTEPFDFGEVFNLLSTKYGLIPRRTNPNTIIGFIGDIKIDVIYHPFQWLMPSLDKGPFRLARVEDIAAMKMHAITNSGQRPKDFVDIAFLSQRFSYSEIKSMTLKKYPAYDPIILDKSIVYFEDVDRDSIAEIRMIGTKMDWQAIKRRILQMTRYPDRVFPLPPLKG